MLDENGLITIEKRAKLKPYWAREPKQYVEMTEAEILANAGGTLIGDTESYLNYFLVAWKCTKTNKIITMDIGDTNNFNTRKLAWIMQSYRVVGFNFLKYDNPIIWFSYYCPEPDLIQDVSRQLIYGEKRPNEIAKEAGFEIPKTRIIDLIEVCPLKGSLKLYGARIHAPRIQDVPFSVYEPLPLDKIPIVKDYCINDLDETHRLMDFLKDRLELRQAMSIEYREDLMSKSDAQIAEAVISRELYNKTGRWPTRPKIDDNAIYQYYIPDFLQYKTDTMKAVLEKVRKARFQLVSEYLTVPKELTTPIKIGNALYQMGIGGLHSLEKNVSYKSDENYVILDRDVASYYPYIILNQGLYPLHIGPQFLEIYRSIVERRLAAKKSGNKTADKGLKVTINGTFGKTSSYWSFLRSPEMFIQIVITGQLALLMLIEWIEHIDIQVISANTDGIVMLCPQIRVSELEAVIEEWEKTTNFITEETRYKAYYARDVNAYFAIKENGEVKVKGPYSEVGSATGTQLDNNPDALICTDAVKNLLSVGTPIEKTIRECDNITRFVTVRNVKGGAHKDGYYLGKTIRWYHAKGIQGTINYISNNNKVPNTDGARPCMDLPTVFPSDIDYDFYIQKTLEILEEINYLPAKKQLSFF